MEASDNCMVLTDLSLKEVIKRTNIGREDFWGTASTAWLALFHVHCVVFIILFAIIVCWCGLFMREKLQAWRKQSSFLYLLAVYCMTWSLSSVLQYILLLVDINHPPNQGRAVATYSLEVITIATSMNGLLILAGYQYYRLRFHAYQSLTKYVLLTGPSLIIVILIIVIISVPVASPAVVAVVVLLLLLVFVGMMGTTSLVAMYAELWFRTKSSKSLQGSSAGRTLIRRLIFRLVSYIYLGLVPVHMLISFIYLAANNDCIEEAQGNRTMWLSIQTVIKFAELLLVIQCLSVPQSVQKMLKNFWAAKSSGQQSQPADFIPKNITQETTLDNFLVVDPFNSDGVFRTSKPCGALETEAEFESNSSEHNRDMLALTMDICNPSATEPPHQLVKCIDHNVVSDDKVEREILPQAASGSNTDVDEELTVSQTGGDNKMMPLSEMLKCELQDSQLLYSVFDELRSRFNHYLYPPPLVNDFSGKLML